MDSLLYNIVSKSAGVHFIVRNKSQVTTIEQTSNLRLMFLNEEKGQTNNLLVFPKGAKDDFKAVFGKGNRLKEKRGNFAISQCLKALDGGALAVINLRAFDDTLDKTNIYGLNPNINDEETQEVAYRKLFSTDDFWVAKKKNLNDGLFTTDTLLQFGATGTNDISVFVRFSTDDEVLTKTSKGDEKLSETSLEIDDYPAINFDSLVKDYFVTIYLFNNTFTNANTNSYYGQYFDNNGNVDIANLQALSEVAESGFVQKFVGSLIPNLQSESQENISIDEIVNQKTLTSGLLCNINVDLFEAENTSLVDRYGLEFFGSGTTKVPATSDYLLSYKVPSALTTATTVYPLTAKAENVVPTAANKITYSCVKISDNSFEGSFEQGLRVDDMIEGVSGFVKISSIEILDPAAVIGATTDTYTKAKFICDGNVLFTNTNTKIVKVNNFTKSAMLHPFVMESYKPRAAQFTDGTPTRQNDILDMMNSVGIVKGLKSYKGISYIVDSFKSNIEASYKYQYGILAKTLNDSKKFVRCILNDVFIDDLKKSSNPLFRNEPGGNFALSYLETGGNKTYSTKFLTKFTEGAEFCYFFGCENIENNVELGVAAQVSNLFVNKTNKFDVVANESGYLDGITELGYKFDDDDRKYLEKVSYNPIIFDDLGYTIFGNNTGTKIESKQRQIHNSELLAYIQESLQSLARKEPFKKGTFYDYLRLETESKSFMSSLVSANAIEADYVVVCNASNNTTEIANNRIKLAQISYTPINALEKVVFDLTIN